MKQNLGQSDSKRLNDNLYKLPIKRTRQLFSDLKERFKITKNGFYIVPVENGFLIAKKKFGALTYSNLAFMLDMKIDEVNALLKLCMTDIERLNTDYLDKEIESKYIKLSDIHIAEKIRNWIEETYLSKSVLI
jgi:hypothetical protein